MNPRILILWLVATLFILLATTVVASTPNADASPSPKDAHYWYLKYKKQKRKSRGQYRRILYLNQRLKSQRNVISRKGKLSRSIVPWVGLARCESGGRWKYNGSSGFDGGIQFHPKTWRGFGGRTFSEYAYGATPIQQVAIAQKVLRKQGRNAWPGCTAKGAW